MCQNVKIFLTQDQPWLCSLDALVDVRHRVKPSRDGGVAPGDQGEPHQVHHHVVELLSFKDLVLLTQILNFVNKNFILMVRSETDKFTWYDLQSSNLPTYLKGFLLSGRQSSVVTLFLWLVCSLGWLGCNNDQFQQNIKFKRKNLHESACTGEHHLQVVGKDKSKI